MSFSSFPSSFPSPLAPALVLLPSLTVLHSSLALPTLVGRHVAVNTALQVEELAMLFPTDANAAQFPVASRYAMAAMRSALATPLAEKDRSSLVYIQDDLGDGAESARSLASPHPISPHSLSRCPFSHLSTCALAQFARIKVSPRPSSCCRPGVSSTRAPELLLWAWRLFPPDTHTHPFPLPFLSISPYLSTCTARPPP